MQSKSVQAFMDVACALKQSQETKPARSSASQLTCAVGCLDDTPLEAQLSSDCVFILNKAESSDFLYRVWLTF